MIPKAILRLDDSEGDYEESGARRSILSAARDDAQRAEQLPAADRE